MSEIKGCPMWQGTEPLSTPCYKTLCAWYTNDECAIASIARSLHVTTDTDGGFHTLNEAEFRALMDRMMGGGA